MFFFSRVFSNKSDGPQTARQHLPPDLVVLQLCAPVVRGWSGRWSMPSALRQQQQSHEGSIAGSWLPRIIQGNRPWHHDVAVKHEIARGSNVGASTKMPSQHQ
ncbi:hypothetical protein TcG_09541 [Trypanosoma cruzi]|nr:hypothetical protein TcG_09541 [Trypanosoma cruzi]